MKAKETSARVFQFVRQYRKISQKQLAIKLNVNQSTISKIEKGLHFPSAMVLKRLEQYTNKSMSDLMTLSR
ncbi:helix-turn-helix domain-containing protein [Marivirga atlantica]|jgi:transcriptional regulator with XRE-family HTH domain|uniref:Helix-turn-helix transcriptional regulator n=1 Tax=Marivirga atlantica TaxID=1548457 RepID=A0A937DKB9_9BACT|nr:helix-turn-helix transcriptional regulator [Marivirga atlantica]MBL0765844.1 helix-turn-helix transcriptional regulator [Marivirga atlantica]